MDAFSKIKDLFENTPQIPNPKAARCILSSCPPYHTQKSKIQYQSNFKMHQILPFSKKE